MITSATTRGCGWRVGCSVAGSGSGSGSSSSRAKTSSAALRPAAGVEPVELLVGGAEPVEPRCSRRCRRWVTRRVSSGSTESADLPRGLRGVAVALWHVGDPGNIGTLLRAADGFGAGLSRSPRAAPTRPARRRCGPRRAPSFACRSAVRRGSVPRVALAARVGTRCTALELPRARHLRPGRRARRLAARRRRGLRLRATIPQPGEAESLNVAMAGAIALYEQARRSIRAD